MLRWNESAALGDDDHVVGGNGGLHFADKISMVAGNRVPDCTVNVRFVENVAIHHLPSVEKDACARIGSGSCAASLLLILFRVNAARYLRTRMFLAPFFHERDQRGGPRDTAIMSCASVSSAAAG